MFVKVKGGCLIAGSIRNMIPMLVAVLKFHENLKNEHSEHLMKRQRFWDFCRIPKV